MVNGLREHMLSPAAVERFITKFLDRVKSRNLVMNRKFLDRVKSRLGSDQAAQ